MVTTLDLINAEIGDQGAEAIANVLWWTKLTSLNLRDNGIRDQGARAIANVLHGAKLLLLDLRANRIRNQATIDELQSNPITQLYLRSE